MSLRFPLLAGVLATACDASSPAGRPVVLLVSFDTTRADALSCYGGPGARTPTLDLLAERGVRFEWALSQSPTTLSSHTSALSGLDPHQHRVVRNGFPVPSDVPLAQERFGAAGWETIAVIGSFALEGSMGLSRGFSTYDDGAWRKHTGQYLFSADEVTERALQAIDGSDADKPLFLFVHYYDPHMTWSQAPGALRAQFIDPTYTGPVGNTIPHLDAMTAAARAGRLTEADARQARGYYLAEVAWADMQLGRLLAGMQERGLLDDSLVVLMSDHGEMLAEHRERPFRHGPDVDLTVTHVPLIVSGQGRFATPQGAVVSDLVRIQDVAATLLGAAGLGADIGEARDLGVTWTEGAPPLEAVPSFSEANRPHEVTRTEGWPNLMLERGVALDGYLLTRAPWLQQEQLYRIDAAQTPVEDPARAAALGALLDAWDAAAPGARKVEMSAETRAALEALGYLTPTDAAEAGVEAPSSPDAPPATPPGG